ncbi:MAG: translocation/assembly module TamB domain-containing protein [Vicinamibacterales bacterium]
MAATWRWPAAATRRRVLLGLAVGVPLLVLAALHLPPVRARVLAVAVDRLRQAGIEAAVDGLDYNLVSLRVSLGPTTLTAAGADTPFLTFDRAVVNLPWSVVTGRLAIQSLEVARPMVTIRVDEAGGSNLPASASESAPEAESAPLDAIDLGALSIRDLGVRYTDAAGTAVTGRRLSLVLTGADPGVVRGRLWMEGGLDVQVPGTRTALSRLDAGLAFDGTEVTVDGLVAEAPEARLRVDGRVAPFGTAPSADLRYEGRLHVARLAALAGADAGVSGPIDVSGTVEGALADPTIAVTALADTLTWRDRHALSLALDARVTTEVAAVERLRLGVDRGLLEARGRVGLADQMPSHVEGEWTALDLGDLAATASPDGPRVAALASGRLTGDWTGPDPSSGSAALEATLTAPPVRGALPIRGHASARLDAGTWSAALDGLRVGEARLDGRLGGRWPAADPAASSLDGRVAARIADLPAFVAELADAGVPVEASALSSGHASADVTLSGSIAAPAGAATIDAADVELGGVGPGTLRLRASADPARLAVTTAEARLGGNRLDARLDVVRETGALTGAVSASLDDLAAVTSLLPAPSRPAGTVTLDAALAGTLDAPEARVTGRATGLAAAGQHVDALALSARLARQVLTVDRLEVTQGEGRASGTATYALDTGRYAFELTGQGLTVAPIPGDQPLPVAARVDLEARGDGTPEAPHGTGSIAVRDLTWGDYAIGEVQVHATADGATVAVTGVAPALDARLDAEAALEAPHRFTATAAIDAAALDTLIAEGGPAAPVPATSGAEARPITGAVTATLTAEGALDRPADATADLDLRLLDVTAAGAPLALDGPARLRYHAGAITADRIVLRTGATTLTADGRFGGDGDGDEDGTLTVTLAGQAADLVPVARLAAGVDGLDASGTFDLRVEAGGRLEAPRLHATAAADGLTVSVPDLPPVSGGTLRASFDRGLLTLTSLGATWQGATIEASAVVPVTLAGDALPEGYLRTLPALPGRATARARLDGITAQVAAPFVDDATLEQLEIGAAATITLDAASTAPEDVTAVVTFDDASLVAAGQRLAQDRPTTLRLADGRLTVDTWSWSGGANALDVTGGATLVGDAPALDATLTGSLDLRMLRAAVPDASAAGRARFDVHAGGPLDAPTVEGEIAVSDGEVALRDPRVALTGLEGRIALDGDRVRLVDVTATANGGSLTMRGDVALDGVQPVDGSVTLQGRGLALELPEDLRSELDLDLTLALQREGGELGGTVTILRGSYRTPVSLAEQLLAGVRDVPGEPPAPGFLDRLRLSVDVVSQDGIVVDNNYGRLDLGADLTVIGTAANPALAGRMTIAEGGSVFLGGQTWTLERGTVDFTNAATIEPTLDLSLTTRVQQYDVRLSVAGTPETLEANLSSPDGISQADAISLLLTGSLADERAVAQTEVARGQLLLLLSGELLGFAGRAVGLDSAQVGRGLGGAGSSFDLLATDSDPAARLTVSKRLRRDVEIVFSRSLRDANDITWIAIYRPIRAIELRTTTLDDNARSYEFRHELTFGGPPQRPAAARTPPPRVARVDITGAGDEEALAGRLRLTTGDRFDFYRWQQDKDRLAADLHERGYLEADVRATRTPLGDTADGPAVALEYAIDRGPETSLVVEGASLPGGVVDQMREAWSEAVYDGFLLDDLEALAERALAEDGYLAAAADAEVVEDRAAGRKRIVVRLTPGVRYTDRRLRFEGQEAISADDLSDVVNARGLTLTAWRQPADVEAALAAHYRSLGFLRAEVSIGTPIFSGTSATLPVRIAEGPRFLVGAVDVRGVEARPLDEVRKSFEIESGAPYLPRTVEAARRDVEIAYARDGFNDVRATVTSRPDEDTGRVAVTLDVDEGPQQVLDDVVVHGGTRTSPATVQSALDLDRGAPADRGDVYRAQKRLYDTGVFRRADVELTPAGPVAADGTQPVRAEVTLEELPPYRLRYGLRVTDDTGPLDADRTLRPGAVVDLLRRNLFGRALSAGVAGQLEADRRLARAVVSAPRLFGLPVTTNLFLTRSRQDFTMPGITPFVRDGAEIVAEQRVAPRPDMTVSYTYRFLRTHAFELDQPAGSAFDLRVDVARLTGTFAWDTRDDQLLPHRGWFHSSGIEFAVPSLGSDLRFLKFVLQQYRFTPVGPVVLASAFRLGTAWGFDPPLLFSERYFAGGGTSVRGFAEDALGGVDFLGDPVGGPNSLILNQEVRFPIYKWAGGVAFVDAGNVFDRVRDISFGDLAYGAGLGLRLNTPFGLARIDFGVPLTDRRGQPAGRWYFSLGHAF